MRRLPALVVMVALVFTLLPLTAAAAETADDASMILAVEEDGDDGPVGPNPAARLDEDNAATTLSGYESPDVPFTWGAAWILSFAGLAGLALMVGFYMLVVRRPDGSS
ncbi:MAG: hypothetical protein JJT89_11590 [Nitriliruptoraceae bacterium]|nr:hypothetical protein [Nitriliruptoraceae bacterium]